MTDKLLCSEEPVLLNYLYKYFGIKSVEEQIQEKAVELEKKIIKRLEKETTQPTLNGFPAADMYWMTDAEFITQRYGSPDDWVLLCLHKKQQPGTQKLMFLLNWS